MHSPSSTFLYISIFATIMWLTSQYTVEWDEEGVNYIIKRRKAEGIRLEHHKEIEKMIDDYMAIGMRDVIGWLELQALLVIRVISSHQIENGVKGGVAEIGVHHGKFFAALCLLNRDAGQDAGVAVAIDVFEVQLLPNTLRLRTNSSTTRTNTSM